MRKQKFKVTFFIGKRMFEQNIRIESNQVCEHNLIQKIKEDCNIQGPIRIGSYRQVGWWENV